MSMESVRPVPPPHSETEAMYNGIAALVEATAGPDRHYGFWAGHQDGASIGEATGRLTDLVASKLNVGPGSHVLDVGCGNGGPAVRIAQTSGARVTAIDVDRQALRNGAERARSQEVAALVEFRRIDAMDLPFAPASFDAVLAFESTPHFDIFPLYQGISRVLRPGGRLVVETPYPRTPMTEETRRRISPYLSMLNAVSLDPPEQHLSAARAAGMAAVELIDITDNVRHSFPRLVRGLRERRAHLEAVGGAAEADRLLDAFSAWADATEIGGVIMTFTRIQDGALT
ncbi:MULTISPECIES: SAM-dependent methyltransferase [Streptosporangium]|uniref:Cyclopropane fatty-acyl-phospholipid synthase-like methyltransferase n=1 Tax=Streptosporangium brasiliense TaxID=47480 RepID=A0ABT9REG9_9ACTN|nr:class I SAM-dependent methyltransferase [Streptosporangium brasiliense]MDP9867533.1 cyclopropane fatty-acyl-phospholipid synthase-like methyltransferase [Streptosporangium brasiliense]